MKHKILFRMIFSYLVFAVLGFIMISTFTARYNQKYLEKHLPLLYAGKVT